MLNLWSFEFNMPDNGLSELTSIIALASPKILNPRYQSATRQECSISRDPFHFTFSPNLQDRGDLVDSPRAGRVACLGIDTDYKRLSTSYPRAKFLGLLLRVETFEA
jgi:hypothetical protein